MLIGGTAALLAYEVSLATQDIDTWNNVETLRAAYQKARKETGLEIPMERSTIIDPPYFFEDRLEIYGSGLFRSLTVKIPEVINLILMKAMRAYEHDLEAIAQMVKSQKVELNSLLERFSAEMGSAITPERKRNMNLLAVVERCYSSNDAKQVANELGFRAGK